MGTGPGGRGPEGSPPPMLRPEGQRCRTRARAPRRPRGWTAPKARADPTTTNHRTSSRTAPRMRSRRARATRWGSETTRRPSPSAGIRISAPMRGPVRLAVTVVVEVGPVDAAGASTYTQTSGRPFRCRERAERSHAFRRGGSVSQRSTAWSPSVSSLGPLRPAVVPVEDDGLRGAVPVVVVQDALEPPRRAVERLEVPFWMRREPSGRRRAVGAGAPRRRRPGREARSRRRGPAPPRRCGPSLGQRSSAGAF